MKAHQAVKLFGLALAVLPRMLFATPPEVAEFIFNKSQAALVGRPHANTNWPPWIVSIQQQGGKFLENPPCWTVDAAAPVGFGRLSILLDRQRMQEDLALALLYEGNEQTDIAVQLFDDRGQVIVLDLFGNLMKVGQEAKTDTFIVPLRRYPSATRLTVRRINGQVKVRGLALYPVVGEAAADTATLEALAKLLGDPLSPDNSLAKSIARIARQQDLPLQWPERPPAGRENDTGVACGHGPAQRERPPAGRENDTGATRKPPSTVGLPSIASLVGYWSFDNCDAADDSKHGHDGVVYGKPACTDGVHGKALLFDGQDDWVKVEHSSELDLKESLTVTAWVRYSMIEGGYGSEILWYGDLAPAHDPFTIHLLPGGTFQFRIDTDGGGRSVVADAPDRLLPDTWHFLAATMETDARQQKILKTYVNGQLTHVETVQGRIDYDTSKMWIAIGAVDLGGWQHFHGLIDEVSIYSQPLTKAEIRDLYSRLRDHK